MRDRVLVWLSALCGLAAAVLAMALLSGCSSPVRPDTVPATTPNEAYILEVTHVIAERAGTWANPQITETAYYVWNSSRTEKVPAAGWVPNGGKSHDIYYWASWVNGATQEQMRMLAAHEVAHVACQCRLGEGPN